MADDREIELYKDRVTKVTESWSKEIKKDADALIKINGLIEKVEKGDKGDGRSLDELKKERDKLRASIEDKKTQLEFNLKLLDPPPLTKENEKLLAKLPDFVQEIIKKKGIPVGSGMILKPDISFDFKKGKVKKIGIELRW